MSISFKKSGILYGWPTIKIISYSNKKFMIPMFRAFSCQQSDIFTGIDFIAYTGSKNLQLACLGHAIITIQPITPLFQRQLYTLEYKPLHIIKGITHRSLLNADMHSTFSLDFLVLQGNQDS